MKIPDSIKLGGHTIKIEKVMTKDIDNGGEFRDYFNLIKLRNNFDSPESSIAECFLHEIIQAIRVKNNLEIDHTHLTVLSEVLFQVLRDNELIFHKMRTNSDGSCL